MVLRLSACTVDLSSGEVRHADSVSQLTELEVQLLAYLVDHGGQPVSRDELHREVWGYAEGVQSRAADFSMSRLRRKIEADPKHPQHLLSIRGQGYQFTDAAQHDQATVPIPETSFHGRSGHLSSLSQALGTSRLVSLLGPGGAGKTRLALRFAELHATADLWTGIVFCDLSAARSPNSACEAVAEALSLPPTRSDRSVQVSRALAGRGPLLLVLDNLEQVQATELIVAWLRAAPLLRCLITSRDRLNLAGEHSVPVGPLDAGDAHSLFLTRARAVRPSLIDSPDIAQLVAALEHLPLPIELAAARCRMFSPAQLLQRLGSSSTLLSSTQADRPQRHRTLHAAIDWSWQLLEPWERSALAQCALLPDGFTLSAAESAVDLRAYPTAPGVIDAVATLCDRSLCWLDDAGDEPRLRLYGAIREFVLAHPQAARPIAQARPRWLRWAMTEAEHHATVLHRAQAPHVADTVVRERANLLAAWQATEAGSLQGARLATALAPIVSLRGPWSMLQALLERAVLDATATGDGELIHAARLERAHARRTLGNYTEAVDELRWLIAQELPTEQSQRVRVELGANLRRLGQTDEAAQWLQQVLDAQPEPGVQRGRAQTILGLIHADRGEAERALQLHQQALATFLAAGAIQFEATARTNLAARFRQAHRWDEARHHHRLGMAAVSHTGSRRVEALLLHDQVQLELAAGDLDAAEALGQREHAMVRALGDRSAEGWCVANLASLALEQGRLELAEQRLDHAQALHTEHASRLGMCAVHANRAILALLRGHPAQAAALLRSTSETARELRARSFEALSLGYLAMAEAGAGHAGEARAALNTARQVDSGAVWSGFLDVADGVTLLSEGDRAGAASRLAAIRPNPVQDTRMAWRLLERAMHANPQDS